MGHLSPSNEGLEPRFPDGWGGVLECHNLDLWILIMVGKTGPKEEGR